MAIVTVRAHHLGLMLDDRTERGCRKPRKARRVKREREEDPDTPVVGLEATTMLCEAVNGLTAVMKDKCERESGPNPTGLLMADAIKMLALALQKGNS